MAGALLAYTDAKTAKRSLSFAASSSRPTSDIPVCRALHISCGSGFLQFSSTDLNQVTTANTPAQVEGRGALCAPCDDVDRFLSRIEGEVEFREEGGRLHIRAGSSRCDLPIAKGEVFPHLTVGLTDFDDMPAAELLKALRSVRHGSAPKTDRREPLKAVYFDNEGDTSFIVAMCDHRGAIYGLDRKLSIPSFLLPREALNSVVSLLASAEAVRIHTDGNLGRFETGIEDPTNARQLTTNLVAGDYVNWRYVADKPSGENRFFPDAVGLRKAVSAVSAMRPTSHKTQAVRFTLTDAGVDLELAENHRANAEGCFDCDIEGEGYVGLNPEYVIDALNQIDGEVEISFSDTRSQVQISAPGSPLRQFISPRRA